MQQSDPTDGSRLTTTLARYSALAATAAVPAANAAIVTGSVNDTVGVGGTGTEAPSGKTFLSVDITDELGLTTLTDISFNSSTSYLFIYGANFRNFSYTNSFGGYRGLAGETWDMIGTTTAGFGDVNFSNFQAGTGYDPAGWNNGGFLAFRFDNAGTDNYGWMRLEGFITGPTSGYVEVVDWGYDDTGAKIEMGATGVPAPSTGLLALAGGFPAVAAYRRRKRKEREAQAAA
ncbi:hypothetical protein CKO31_07340 [Thiohalocapsa halophila]|uniref:PEP-CTERM sorting domain-containing protein n=1 Tax=Thiohalocapsa halophila TaxID=69359 RepID=A0ABS1CF67_9GAMM|nr:hypothetical protein [Thiohalocapsa halophila]MBK1630561.1 hypothetical protein [Thiohalocapsa halophila]